MFKGRYGADKLGFLLIIASIILSLVAALLKAENGLMKILLMTFSGAIVLFAAYRVFSRNIPKRKRELRALKSAEEKLLMIFGRHPEKTDEDDEEETYHQPEVSEIHDEYRHFRCPKCKRSLKVPAGKGYIKVICPSCSYKFMKHT